jgi:hypothetical protein
MIGKNSDQDSQYSDDDYEEVKKIREPFEKVIMDIDPKKIEKKDHIFMDFFSMYG